MDRAQQALLSKPVPEGTTINPIRDPNTLSNYNNFKTTHTLLDFKVDFEKQRLSGKAILHLISLTNGETDQIVLDSKGVDVTEVRVGNRIAKYEFGQEEEIYGKPLSINIGAKPKKDEIVEVEIAVSTTDECKALQWLKPEQTSTGKYPYMFSQCEAINARSVFPCQDTPDVKSTYDFRFTSPLPVVASGLLEGDTDESDIGKEKTYVFKQNVPIPSYLVAVASGEIVSADIGPRSKIWTGPNEIEAAKWEFDNSVEKFLQTAEKIVYPYVWGTYNVLILPPSFPFGGMENPIYTFATPTLLSGDRENIEVIAHEAAHSWSGNLVTMSSFEHFWLNEGWTMYLERRIMMAFHGDKYRDFSAIMGWKSLEDAVEQYGPTHEFTKLVRDLKGCDPEDAFSTVPYEKGFTFLYYIEGLIGMPKFDEFMPHYFTEFKNKSVDSYEFKACLLDFFATDASTSSKLEQIDWDAWFYKPGLPPKPNFDTSMVDASYALAEKWRLRSHSPSSTDFEPSPDDIKGLLSAQTGVVLDVLEQLPTPLKASEAKLLGDVYGLRESRNAELLTPYFQVAMKARESSVYPKVSEFLGKVGRMKFVRPLYRMLVECDKGLARETFERNRSFYHPICRGLVEKDLGLRTGGA